MGPDLVIFPVRFVYFASDVVLIKHFVWNVMMWTRSRVVHLSPVLRQLCVRVPVSERRDALCFPKLRLEGMQPRTSFTFCFLHSPHSSLHFLLHIPVFARQHLDSKISRCLIVTDDADRYHSQTFSPRHFLFGSVRRKQHANTLQSNRPSLCIVCVCCRCVVLLLAALAVGLLAAPVPGEWWHHKSVVFRWSQVWPSLFFHLMAHLWMMCTLVNLYSLCDVN